MLYFFKEQSLRKDQYIINHQRKKGCFGEVYRSNYDQVYKGT